MAFYYTSPRQMSYGKTGYSVKIRGIKETLCNVCGDGEEARRNAEKIAEALNAADAAARASAPSRGEAPAELNIRGTISIHGKCAWCEQYPGGVNPTCAYCGGKGVV